MDNPMIKWPKGCRAAVSLSYDDGIPNHPQVVAPALEAHGIRGTFYTPLKSDLMQNPLTWRALAGRGHELGNHTVFHPCWNVKGEYDSWLSNDFNLENYTAESWLDEVRTANEALSLVDGRHERTFGNTCWDNYIGPRSAPICLEPLIEQVFLAARGVETTHPVNLVHPNFNNLGTISCDERSFGDFTPELDEILDSGGWVIYTFHGVGQGSHNLYIDTTEHLRLLDFLREHSRQIWTAPVIDVVNFLKK